jgi:hypothetical protein
MSHAGPILLLGDGDLITKKVMPLLWAVVYNAQPPITLCMLIKIIFSACFASHYKSHSNNFPVTWIFIPLLNDTTFPDFDVTIKYFIS